MPMDSPILPSSRIGPALLAAIQAQHGEVQIQNLLALVGENLDLVLMSTEGSRARLQMPSGQIFVAEGELSYPPGTRLTVQVQPPGPDSVGPRLKLLEALPPPPAPILAPLQQGEALQLLARLRVPEPAPEIAALARLFAELAPPPSAAALPAAQPAEIPLVEPRPVEPRPAQPGPTQPAPGRILEFLKELPPTILRDLERILLPDSPGRPTLPEVAEALRILLQAGAPNRTPAAPGSVPAPADLAMATLVPGTAPGELTPAVAKLLGLLATTGQEPPIAEFPTGPVPAAKPGPDRDAPPPPVALAVQNTLQAVPLQPLPPIADPALEPLKNLLLFLLRPRAEAAETSPDLAEALTRSAAEMVRKSPKAPASPSSDAGQPAQPPAPGPVQSGGPKAPAFLAKTAVPQKPAEGPPARSSLGATPEPPPRTKASPGPLTPAPVSPGDSAAAITRSWESWMSAGVKALSDPQVSPREAPFHLAQAREGTAFFELPLPWEGANRTLQMWVESDAGKAGGGSREATTRVLVGVQFSALGETRVGLVQSGTRLQVRVWAEHAEVLKAREEAIRSDLADLGPGLDFQVLPLGEPGEAVPSLRALANGTGFQALG